MSLLAISLIALFCLPAIMKSIIVAMAKIIVKKARIPVNTQLRISTK
jgi:hypothetical protein